MEQSVLSHLDIRRLSQPYLKALNEHTKETVHLLVRQGQSAVYIEKLESLQLPVTVSRIGISVPLYCTAAGKVLLAYLRTEDLVRALRQMEPRCRTTHTITSIPDLQKHLERIRKCGYSFDLEENELHVRCVAAPIWDHAGAVNASLSVSGPSKRMPVSRLRELASVVQEAGIRISRELGYQGPVELQRNLDTQNQSAAMPDSQQSAGSFDRQTVNRLALFTSPRDVMSRIFDIHEILRLAAHRCRALSCEPVPNQCRACIHPLIERQGDAAENHVERGLEFARTGNLESAELELRKAVELNRADAAALSSLATVLAMEKKFDESTVLFARALKINPARFAVPRISCRQPLAVAPLRGSETKSENYFERQSR